MTTENEARDLLARAADTIDVDVRAPMTLTGLPEPRPLRIWSALLVGAAVVVLVVGVAWFATQNLGSDPLPLADREPVEQPYVPAADELPSVLGYDEETARTLLEGRGLEVSVKYHLTGCRPPGIVLTTDPGGGAQFGPGDGVTLTVTRHRQAIDCLGEMQWAPAWDLMRFARGLAEPEMLASEVDVLVVGGGSVRLSSEQVRDPAKWVVCADGVCHSPLAALEQQASSPNGSQILPMELQAERIPTSCEELLPEGVEPGMIALHVGAGSIDGQLGLCPPDGAVYFTWGDGLQIDTVVLHPVSPAPAASTQVDATRAAAAKAFVTWARDNGPAPAFADRVRLMFGGGGAFGATPWVDEPGERSRWSGCSGLGFPDCGLDPVAVVHHHDGRIVASAGRSSCPGGGAIPDRFADAALDVVRLDQPEAKDCADAWAVELWINDDGEIYAVNLAMG